MRSSRRFRHTAATPALALALCAVPLGAACAFEGPHAAFVTMTDGLRIDVDLRWPEGPLSEQGWPAIILAHSRRGKKEHLAEPAEHYADRGYVTLAYSGRGDGASTGGGDSGDTSAATRGRDVGDLRKWLIEDAPRQVRVNPERIGMTGASQGALNTWYGAILGGGLAAIVPQCFALHTWDQGFVNNGSLVFRLHRLQASHPVLAVYAPRLVRAWTRKDALADRLPSLQTPVLTQMAMLDIWAPATDAVRDYLAATSAQVRMIYIGTGGHGTPDTDEAYRDGYLRDAWFDHLLKGEDNGIAKQPKIHVSLLDSLEKVAFDAFPHPEERRAGLYLNAGGALTPTSPAGGVGADAFENDPGGYTPMMALADGFVQERLVAHFGKDTLHYQTPPLEGDVVVLGIPQARLFVDGTAQTKYQVNVHLTDDGPGAEPRLIAWGTYLVAKSAHAEGGAIAMDLSYTGRRVKKGHRIGLTVTNLDLQVLTPGQAPLLRHLPYFDPGTTSVLRNAAQPSSVAVPLIEGSLAP